MKQSLLHGGATVINRSERIREIYESLGGAATVRALAVACIQDQVFDSEFVDAALLKAAQSECKKALKKKDEGGLPYAGPVRESDTGPEWVQRVLWNYEEYIVYRDLLIGQRDKLDSEIELLDAERIQRFGS